ncbi:Cupredoxin, partial [Thozetella sp. PMI_491]
ALAACASAAMIRIDVGQSGLTFTPSTVNASTGDILDFHFHAINHSVVQGDFNNPCKPIQTGGFFSGFMPTSSGENANTFQVQVNSTDPIFFYCAQNTLTHCKSGMSGAVNPTSGQTLAAYQDKAKSADTAVSPASVFGGTIVSSGTTSPSSS